MSSWLERAAVVNNTNNGSVVEVFGEDMVVHLDRAACEAKGIDQEDSEILSTGGLPIELDVLFTLDVDSAPRVFDVVAPPAEGLGPAFVLGGPPGVVELRYVLDTNRGFVALLAFEDDGIQVEVINSTLRDFVDFLCGYARLGQDVRGMEREERVAKVKELTTSLREQDPLAFRADDSWWVVVLDGLVS